MSLFPAVLDGGLSSSWGWLAIHFLWTGALVGLTGAFLRIAFRPTTAELRYLIGLMSLAGLAGAVFVSAALAFTSGSAAVKAWPVGSASLRTVFLQFLPIVWLAGAGGSLIYLALGLWGTRRLQRPGDRPPEDSLTEALERWKETLRIPQTVRIAISKRIGLPLVAGVFRPWIVLPTSAAEWSDRQVDHVLLHELGHVRRHDNLVTFCQRVFEAVFWFHPAVWMASRWLDEDREHCCDEFVLALTHDPRDYAETLIALAASAPPAVLAGGGIPLSQKPLQVRVRRILFREESTMFRPRVREIAATISCGLVWSVVVFGEEPTGVGPRVAGRAAVTPRTPHTEPVVAAVDSTEGSMLRRVLIDLVGRNPTDEEYDAYLTGQKTLGQLAQAATALNNRTPVTSEIDQRLTELARIVKRSWGPEQVIGPPDTMNAGDQVTAWASLSQDAQEEWLICDFGKEVAASSVRIHETYNPGSLVRIMFLNGKDEETLAWEGEDPTPRDQPKGTSVIPISPDGKVKRIKLYFDSVAVPGWNEIDAVGLADEDGTITWTAAATASSTFAEPAGSSSTPGLASWAPMQAAGEPNTPGAGDAVTAWASATTDGQIEWLLCRYEQDQMPAEIVVHENYNPGAVTKITAFDADGKEHLAWEGEDPTPRTEPRGVSVFPMKLTFATKQIKVYIDSPSVPGWNEIDAVGLRDAEGKSVWAKKVEASSTYANFSGGGSVATPFVTIPAVNFEQMQTDLNDLKASVKELQSLKDEIKELKELLKKPAK
jgi:beta-lactamase regulating signal transducer with metallopeptidase domain